jgi:hypothetical protein
MLDSLDLLFKNLKDPMMVLVFMLIIGGYIGMGWIINGLLKVIKTRDEYVKDLHECLSTGLGESNKTQAKLVTLIETVVYRGRGGNGNLG